MKMLHNNEYVLATKESTIFETILVDGFSAYGKKTKEDYLEEGCLVLPKKEAFELIYENENSLYITEWTQITEKKWWDALEELPPLRYKSFQQCTFFFCSEAYTGNIHSCYCSVRGKYFTAMRRLTTNYDEMYEEIKAFYEPTKKDR